MGLFSITTYAQNRQVTGTVTDNSGIALPGVNVLVKGTSNGTVTDFDGIYSVNDVSSIDVLVFSSVGMLTKEVSVGTESVFNVVLSEDVEHLDEVVVVGYTSTTRKNIIQFCISAG